MTHGASSRQDDGNACESLRAEAHFTASLVALAGALRGGSAGVREVQGGTLPSELQHPKPHGGKGGAGGLG